MTTLLKDLAREDATRVLDEHWDGQYPVDPARIANRMGIKVWRTDMPDDTSGAIVKREGAPAEIYFDADEPPQRQRFTCAHEIGHYIDRQRHQDAQYSFQDLRRGAANTPEEFYADHFAGNLLMPRRKVLAMWNEGNTTNDMADFFAVSLSAMGTRLRSLGLAA